MRKFGFLPSAALLVVLAAACGGSSSSNKTPAATTPAGGTAAAGATPAATTAATSSSGGSGGGAVDPGLKAISQTFAKATFKGTYKLTGAGDPQSLGDGTMVLYKDGSSRFRFDVTGTQDGQPVSLVLIEKDGVTVFCLKDAGGLGQVLGVPAGEGACFKTDASDPSSNPAASLSQSLTDLESGDVTMVSKSTRSIAGRSATCYVTKSAANKSNDEECFSDDGVVLYSKGGDDGSAIEATDISGSVVETDFDPPYSVHDLPMTGGSLQSGQ
jgi:hypothetical protein